MRAFLDEIKSQGFVITPCLLPTTEIDSLAASLEQSPLVRSRAGIRHAMKHPAVAEVAENPRLLGMVRAVLGESAIPYRATLFDKSPDSNWLVVWHQDTALPLQRRTDTPGWGPWSVKERVVYAHAPAKALAQVLALRVHLNDSTADNGPLRVLPGTHTEGVLTDDAIHDLAERTAPVDCTVSRGGVVAMRPLLIHASSKSQATFPRRVLHIEYAASPSVEGLQLAVA